MAITYNGTNKWIIITGSYDTGTATSATSSTIVCSSKSWTTNVLRERRVYILSGTGAGQSRWITSNTGTTQNIRPNWTTTPDSTSVFHVSYNYADIKAANDSGSWGVVTQTKAGQYVIDACLYLGNTSATFSYFHDCDKQITWSHAGLVANPNNAGKTYWYEYSNTLFEDGHATNYSLKQSERGCQHSFADYRYDANTNQWIWYVNNTYGGTPKVHLYGTTLDSLLLEYPNQNFCMAESNPTSLTSGTEFHVWNCKGNVELNASSTPSAGIDVFNYTLNAKYCVSTSTSSANMGFRGSGTTSNLFIYGTGLGALGNTTNVNQTFRNIYGRGNSAVFRAYNLTYDQYLIDCDFDTWVFRWDGSNSCKIFRQWSHNFTVKDSSSAAVQSAQCALYNNASTAIFNAATDSSGILAEQIVSEGYYTPASTTALNSYNNHTFKVRKYGYQFVNQTRAVTAKVVEGITLSANTYAATAYATVAAYTGIAIDGSAKTITLTSDHTALQIYEYSQYWAALSANMGYDEPLSTTTGTTFALYTGWKIINANRITSGTIYGGTVRYATAGTYTQSLSTTTIDCTTTGTYDFRTASLSGTIHLGSSTNATVTIQIPPGTSYVNDNPSYVTVDASAAVTGVISGIVTGSRVQVYNVTDATEVYNGTPGTSLSTNYTYTSDKSIRIRIMQAGYQWYTVNTTLSSSGYNVSVSQSADTVYNNNGYDGSTLTEFSVSGTTIKIYINTGATDAIPKAYNWWCYLLSTASGIRDQDFTNFTATDTAHYTFLNGQQFKNIGSVALTLTGAVVKDGSGSVAACVDTTGGNIYITPSNVEVYNTNSGSGLSTAEKAQLTLVADTIPNLDTTVSSRLATSSYSAAPSAATVASAVMNEALSGHTTAGTAGKKLSDIPTTTPPTVTQIRQEIDTNSTKLDVAVSTRLATAGYTSPPTASTVADAVWDEALSGHSTTGTAGKKLTDTPTTSSSGPTVIEIRQEMDENSVKLQDISKKVKTVYNETV